ncbi:hypothetical protein P3T73_09445 [Kiritimatiellota bacterium B12222]|nr:hypothetical protein P3T73_09445 [Kiritimatiellota bacterium B12222]
MNPEHNPSARTCRTLLCAAWVILCATSCASKPSSLSEKIKPQIFPITSITKIVVHKNPRFLSPGEPLKLEIDDPKLITEIVSYLYPGRTSDVLWGIPPKWRIECWSEDNTVVTLGIETAYWSAEKQHVSGEVKEGFDAYMSRLFYNAIPADIKVQQVTTPTRSGLLF